MMPIEASPYIAVHVPIIAVMILLLEENDPASADGSLAVGYEPSADGCSSSWSLLARAVVATVALSVHAG